MAESSLKLGLDFILVSAKAAYFFTFLTFLKMKKIFSILFILCLNSCLEAQQVPLFTQYQEHQNIINPAMVSNDVMQGNLKTAVGLSARRQWAGISNCPETQVLRNEWDIKIGDVFHFITGGYLIRDGAGGEKVTGAMARLTGFFSDNPKNRGFAGGFNIGAVQWRFDPTDRKAIVTNDPLLAVTLQKTYPDLTVGIMAYSSLTDDEDNIVKGGISVQQVLQPHLKFKTDFEDFSLRRQQHYHAQIGYNKFFDEANRLEFSSWFRYVKNVPFQADFNTRYYLQNYFWLGVGYSTNKILHAEFGFLLGSEKSKFRIGYSTDYSMNPYWASYFGRTHEINLTYALFRNANE